MKCLYFYIVQMTPTYTYIIHIAAHGMGKLQPNGQGTQYNITALGHPINMKNETDVGAKKYMQYILFVEIETMNEKD